MKTVSIDFCFGSVEVKPYHAPLTVKPSQNNARCTTSWLAVRGDDLIGTIQHNVSDQNFTAFLSYNRKRPLERVSPNLQAAAMWIRINHHPRDILEAAVTPRIVPCGEREWKPPIARVVYVVANGVPNKDGGLPVVELNKFGNPSLTWSQPCRLRKLHKPVGRNLEASVAVMSDVFDGKAITFEGRL